MTLLACMGELLIDFLPINEDGTTVGFRMHPGGAPMNVAVGLARLGQPVVFASRVSTDFFGRTLRTYLEAEGVDTRYLPGDTASSTLAFVAYEHGEPAYTFYGEGAADTRLQLSDLPASFFADVNILHFGSISLLRGDTPAAVEAVAERLRGKALLSFDPNIRTGLIRDEASYRATLERMFRVADVVKISAEDLRWVLPERTVEEAATELLGYGPGMVVITRGGAGALAVRTGGERTTVPQFTVQVVDTVGAGDSFSGGLLAALAERNVINRNALAAMSQDDLRESMRFASATAAITCSRAGANPPNRAEVVAFLALRAGE